MQAEEREAAHLRPQRFYLGFAADAVGIWCRIISRRAGHVRQDGDVLTKRCNALPLRALLRFSPTAMHQDCLVRMPQRHACWLSIG